MSKKRESTSFGRRLRALRESANLTQTELAQRAGMVYQVLAKYERGQNEPGWPIVLKLAEALGVTPDAFLDDDADEPPAGTGTATRPRGK